MDNFFIEDCSSDSEDEAVCRWRTRVTRKDSPQTTPAFPIISGRDNLGDQPCDPSSPSHDDTDPGVEDRECAEDSDQSVEEWMVIDEIEFDGDSNIQLNLSYSNISFEGNKEEKKDKKDVSTQDLWAVSKKDKGIGENAPVCRYYTPGHSLICPVCKRTGHLAKNCPLQKKVPVCALCGVRGHFKKNCPSRHCPKCGLPSHGLRICNRPPVWNQHCQRCGMTGHLSDTCPDNWRQYHQTITMGPPRIQATQAFKRKKRPAYCYNCSSRDHYGHECKQKRMRSGVFIAQPHVCHYGTFGLHQINSGTQNQNTDFMRRAQLLPEQQQFHEAKVKEDRFQNKNKMKQKSRKMWPEQRRERHEVKRLRREAQARREGGVLGQCLHNPDDETLYSDPFGTNRHCQTTCTPKKTKKKVAKEKISRNFREAELWKKRRGKKRAFLRPHKEMDYIWYESLSPKQRVRHRQK